MAEKPISMQEYLSKQLNKDVENMSPAEVAEKLRAIARRSPSRDAEAANKFAEAIEEYDRAPAEDKDFRKAVLTILEAFLKAAERREEE